MLEILLDVVVALVIGVVSNLLSLPKKSDRASRRTSTRFRSFSGWGIRWTALDHEDDHTS
ncbi:hypothetical protein AE618_09650 [Bosea vaviloviae]|jgi:hypothetical protein|uniref:Uncharacterized protein n=1 Tax=Bosea vaviloviae TaxID=1526658 RepID=A0A0N1N2H9_9HYPH|nr:hypothetical protein AE618_09650 [Bosea vaviloviae]